MKNKNRKNLISLLVTLILILAIPALLYLVQQIQIFTPRAGGPPILFSGPNLIDRNGVQKLKLDEQGKASVGLQITSPLGPPRQ